MENALNPLFSYNYTINKATQILLSLKYKEIVNKKEPLPSFNEIGFRVHSQSDEDGILHFIFSLIGTTNKTVIEMCAGNGIECNSTNLLINHGWNGLLFDGNRKSIETGINFFNQCKDTKLFPPKLIQAWITAENVCARHGT